MIILLGLAMIFTIGIVLLAYFDDSATCEIFGLTLIVAGSACLLITIITIPLERYGTRCQIEEFSSIKQSITQSRLNINVESAAMQLKIIKTNQWLVRKKYWNDTLFDIWIPDEVEGLKPLK